MRNGRVEQAETPNRRSFLAGCLGLGVGTTVPTTLVKAGPPRTGGPAPVMSPPRSRPDGLLSWRLDRMEFLGIPEDWSAVRLGLHPFAPERTLVLPSGERLRYDGRCGDERYRRIVERIERGLAEMGHEPPSIPRAKRDAILWIMDGLTGYYHRPDLFEDWALGLAGREALGSTQLGDQFGLAHQFQHRGQVRVDCLPMDWWLILCPGGIDWASLDGEPVHALFVHVSQMPWSFEDDRVLHHTWSLSCKIAREVDDWRRVSCMGRLSAARYLNPIAVRALEAMDD